MNFIDCPECEGEGKVYSEYFVPQGFDNDYGFPSERLEHCENCNGSGQIKPMEDEEDAYDYGC